MSRFGIIGKGAWGQALGQTFAANGNPVAYWTRDADPAILADASYLIAVVPAQQTRQVLTQLGPALPSDIPLILTAKGLEQGTLLRQSEIAAAILPDHPLAILSGPSFATDLAASLPTAVTLATTKDGNRLQAALSTPSLRPYLSDDLTGVELGGALKNVIAIACGAAIGAGLGESARAALMARGFSELTRIGLSLGAKLETLSGLSGLGDLTLTATSLQSRNFRYGVALGETGQAPRTGTYEGAASASAAHALAHRLGVDAPIIETVAALVAGKLTVQEAIERLMTRPLRRE
ncbi:MAG: NAD(P)H-dependent glycerol-3-phosphate dehydrogenase [Pseudomonadota bacterium]